MTPDERRRILDSFGNAPRLLCASLRGFPKKMWQYKSTPDRWSIHELVVHLADTEAIEYVTCRRFIAEPGSPQATFDAGAWASRLGYFHQNTRDALQIITGLRHTTHYLLATLPESLWRMAVDHPRHGTLSLERWLAFEERRIPELIAQMTEIYDGWLKLNPPRKSPSSRSERAPVNYNFLVSQ